jgi:alpha-D-xyloside xylohydrolase
MDKRTTLKNLKPLWYLIRGRIRYPFLKGKLGENNPNVYFGLTDHPLDVDGSAIFSLFTILRKMNRKKASCVLQVEFKEKKSNSFLFNARGFDIYQIRDFDFEFAHNYKINDKTPYKDLILQIDILKDDSYRLRLTGEKTVPENKTPMISTDITKSGLDVGFTESDDRYTLSTEKINLEIYKENFCIRVLDRDGNLITETGGKTKNEFPTTMDSFPLGFAKEKTYKETFAVESFVNYPGEGIYGLGEGFNSINKMGKTFGFWHFEGMGNTSGRNYKNIPFFMSTRGYGVFFNESRPITYWVGSREYCKTQVAVEGDLMDYYFFYGPTFKEILNNYTELTGKASVPPKWSFGTWMSRISYFSQKEVMDTARKMRDMNFPGDVIHIDTGWFEKDWQCDWKFDPERFPDPEGMFKEARKMGFRISLWQAPYVMDETKLYKDAKKNKVLAKNNAPFNFILRFPAHPIDFSKPEAVFWYQKLLKSLLDLGASAIKADFGEGIEPAMKFKEYDGRQMHNLYPLLYNKAAFDITEETTGEGVIWARSAYAGSQRYPVHWSGDNSANYENLLCSLRGGLSLGLSGFTFWSQDTGGFVGTPTDDLYIRWTQISIFQSHIRFHGAPPKYREPWNFKKETQDKVRSILNLRYRLVPYIYSESHVAASEGLPVLRAMVLEFQNDRNVHNMEDQFMCGRNIMVAPIVAEGNTRDIYIPEGLWYDFQTGTKYTGPQWISETCDIERIPFYIRGGTILPLGKEVQNTTEIELKDLTLKVYPDAKGLAEFKIIDDEGTNLVRSVQKSGSTEVFLPLELENISIEIVNDPNSDIRMST